jgi:uncharacterized protein (TIGR02757 family)
LNPQHGPRCSAEPYAALLCNLYEAYNRKEFVHPDPLEFLYDYPDVRDREIAALVAACLAYGNVHQIIKTVSSVLKRIGQPYAFVTGSSDSAIERKVGNFQYRFTTRDELATLLRGIKRIVERYGSLGKCFVAGLRPEHDTTQPALSHFVEELARSGGGRPSTLLPLPERGSACKRLNLFLRWMARRDRVDPGGWDDVPAIQARYSRGRPYYADLFKAWADSTKASRRSDCHGNHRGLQGHRTGRPSEVRFCSLQIRHTR